jgi:xanthine dehydrogenase small subunit/xanthine dehydrogenase large subunit
MLQGKHVLTVEGLALPKPHPTQEAMAQALGSQCGYCTPGIVMSLFELAYRSDLTEPWKVDDQLCGNLCRCTGYRPIRDAALSIAGKCHGDDFSKRLKDADVPSMAFHRESRDTLYATPTSFEELFEVADRHPDARFVCGGTDLSLEITKQFKVPSKLVSLEGLPALRTLEETQTTFLIGATVTLAELEDFSASRLPSLHRMIRYFGARQIKHRATVGGNLCTASPIGDLAPALLSLDATVVLRSRDQERRVPLAAFFASYRKTVLQPKEIVDRIEIPRPHPSARQASYKVSKRRELDISTVSAGMYVRCDERGVVVEARLAFGGMAATPQRAPHAEAAMVGQVWSTSTASTAAAALKSDFAPLSDHRGSAQYRALVAANLVRAFYEETQHRAAPQLTYRHAATVLLNDEVTRD